MIQPEMKVGLVVIVYTVISGYVWGGFGYVCNKGSGYGLWLISLNIKVHGLVVGDCEFGMVVGWAGKSLRQYRFDVDCKH
jgi:hypothetical protein